MSSRRRCSGGRRGFSPRLLLLIVLVCSCAGRPKPGTVLIGEARYDDFFRAANSVLAEVAAEDPPAPGRMSELREQARALGTKAMDLLEDVDRQVEGKKRARVKKALREAAQRLAGIR